MTLAVSILNLTAGTRSESSLVVESTSPGTLWYRHSVLTPRDCYRGALLVIGIVLKSLSVLGSRRCNSTLMSVSLALGSAWWCSTFLDRCRAAQLTRPVSSAWAQSPVQLINVIIDAGWILLGFRVRNLFVSWQLHPAGLTPG